MNEIRFHLKTDPHGYLSNFYELPEPMLIDGKEWVTSEHYFQAAKFAETAPDLADTIRETKSPAKVWRIAAKNKDRRREDWADVKNGIMRQVVWEKFSQNNALGEMLLATGDATLIEHTPTDSYWGDGGDGTGKNMLGTILMEVRSRLRTDKLK